MTTLVDVTFGSPHVSWSNLETDGSILIEPNDTEKLVLTVPLSTGVVALDQPGLCALVHLSLDGVAEDGLKWVTSRDLLLVACKGNATPASIQAYVKWPDANPFAPSFGDDLYLQQTGRYAYLANKFPTYVVTVVAINGAGDLELSLRGRATDGHSDTGVNWTFINFNASYRIVGTRS